MCTGQKYTVEEHRTIHSKTTKWNETVDLDSGAALYKYTKYTVELHSAVAQYKNTVKTTQ